MAAQTMKGGLRDAHENSVFSPIGHQLELENASLLINVTCSTNRRAQNIITLTQVSVNLVEPKTREIAECHYNISTNNYTKISIKKEEM